MKILFFGQCGTYLFFLDSCLFPIYAVFRQFFYFLFLLIFNMNIYAFGHLRRSKANLLSGQPIHSEWYIEAIGLLSLEGAANLPSGRPIHS